MSNEPQWLIDARAKGLVTGETKTDESKLTGPKIPKPNGSKTPLIEEEFHDRNSFIEFVLPIHAQPTTNGGVFKKWMIGVAGKHRKAVCHAFAKHVVSIAHLIRTAQNGNPVYCCITRIGRTMDDDNIAACCKQIRDAVALYFGVGDGPKDPIVWTYSQQYRMFNGIIITLSLEPIK